MSMIMDNEELHEAIADFSMSELSEVKDLLVEIISSYKNFHKDELAFSIQVDTKKKRTIYLLEGLLSHADIYYTPSTLRWSKDGVYLVDFGAKDGDWLEYSAVSTLEQIRKAINDRLVNQADSKLKLSTKNNLIHIVHYRKDGSIVTAKILGNSNSGKILSSLRKNSAMTLSELSKVMNEPRKHADSPLPEKRVHDAIKYIRDKLKIEANSPNDIFNIVGKECQLIIPTE